MQTIGNPRNPLQLRCRELQTGVFAEGHASWLDPRMRPIYHYYGRYRRDENNDIFQFKEFINNMNYIYI